MTTFTGVRFTAWMPAIARASPFALYMVMLALTPLAISGEGEMPPAWYYPLQVGLVALALAFFWRQYDELRGNFVTAVRHGGLALVAGLAVFVAWINLDLPVLSFGLEAFEPPRGGDGSLDIRWLAVRLFGAAIIVPLMEELFWRSFLMRWIKAQDFRAVVPAAVGLRALLLSSIVFGVEHQLWFAGFLAGLVYAGIYMRSANLWTPILAHAVTNLALGIWVISTGNWQFW